MQIPPELMTPEQREERALEVEHEIGREWLWFAVTEAVVIWVPFTVVLVVLTLTDRLSESALVPVAIAGGALSGVLVTYWLTRRIRPLQKELEALRADDGLKARVSEIG